MQQHYIPPPPVPQPGFPVMHGLVNDFGRVHLDPNRHHFEHNMQQPAFRFVQPPSHGHMSDARSFPSNGKPPVGYVGYTFTKHPVERVGQKETWAIANKELMPASQTDLRNQVEKHRKKNGTGLAQYSDSKMNGFKRKQIDELIRECVAKDPDHRFEYVIESIKRDIRRRQSGPETSAMQVILKRKIRPDISSQGPFIGFGNIRPPMSGVVDLSGAEDYEKSSQNSSNGHKPGPYPFERHTSEPWTHVVHSDARPPVQHAHAHEHAHPHDLGNAHRHGHDDFGSKDAHEHEQPLYPHHGGPHFQEDAHDTKHGDEGKTKKHKDKEHQSPKIVHDKKHNSHKSQDYSDSSSSSDSDSSSGDTDRTPDTVISSEDAHYHHKDKKYHKRKHHRKSSSHDHEHEPVKVIYREHRRKEPTRRLSSPPPSHRPRYRHEDVYVEPSPSYRRRAEPTYASERLPYHHRAMSYDDERLHEHDMRGFARRPTVYRRKITSAAHPIDLYEERAERRRHETLDRDIREREDAIRRIERLRREAARGRMESDRMHDYHDDHLRVYPDDRY